MMFRVQVTALLLSIPFIWLEAQQFQELPGYNDFSNLGDGPVAFSDFNNDGFVDLLVGGPGLKIFLNQGGLKFKEHTTLPFAALQDASMAVGDLNGDGFPDIICTGMVKTDGPFISIMVNDGKANFTEMTDTSIEGVQYGAMAIADINNDGLGDVFLTGRGDSSRIAKLYINQSGDQFKASVNNPFAAVDFAAVKMADVNEDGFIDILLSGDTGLVYTSKGDIKNLARVTKLYLNDGSGAFTEVKNTPFIGVSDGSIDIADINGNGKKEILISGRSYFFPLEMKFYEKIGVDGYSEIADTNLIAVDDGKVSFADFDNDGDQDVLVAGNKNWFKGLSKIFLNDGSGFFEEQQDSMFFPMLSVDSDLADIDLDGDIDIVLAGRRGFRYCKIYVNDGKAGFSELESKPITNLKAGDLSIDDFDNDGEEEVLMSGSDFYGHQNVNLIKIRKDSLVIEELEIKGLTEFRFHSISKGDIDGDVSIDLLLTGADLKGEPVTKMYLNKGGGNFVKDTLSSFSQVKNGKVFLTDFNVDGYLDALIIGEQSDRAWINKLYMNNQEGIFIEQDFSLDLKRSCAIEVGDLNSDGSPDIILSDYENGKGFYTRIYLNNGEGEFVEAGETDIEGVTNGLILLQGVNGDNHLDVYISGSRMGQKYIAALYFNDGMGSFQNSAFEAFKALQWGSGCISDLDGDGYPEIIVSGQDEERAYKTLVYKNLGDDQWELKEDYPFLGVISGKIGVGDLNHDSLPDVILMGSHNGKPVTRIYLSEGGR